MSQADTTNNNQVKNPTVTEPEKPASEMTEADAVALNADVHAPVNPNQNQSDNDRVVTDGERDQVKAGLHPKPESGKPVQSKQEQKEHK